MLVRFLGRFCPLFVMLFALPLVAEEKESGEPQGDVVIAWSDAALWAVDESDISSPIAARDLAMVHLAIYDATRSIDKITTPFAVSVKGRALASAEAAAVAAAHRVLTSLYPLKASEFDSLMTEFYSRIDDENALKDGIAVGREVAMKVLEMRQSDFSEQRVFYVSSAAAGEWAPTPPSFASAELPHWSGVKPYALVAPTQFRPKGPPALETGAYAQEWNQVYALGALDSAERTAEQTVVAQFWQESRGQENIVVRWNLVAQQLALSSNVSFSEKARIFAALNIAMVDASIATWDAKYRFSLWRPITAIHRADFDGNAGTHSDKTWTPLLEAPEHPSYVSSHSALSGTAAEVLGAVFGDTVPFTVEMHTQSARRYGSLRAAAEEAGMSRIYGGVEFLSSHREGLELGSKIGKLVMEKFPKENGEQMSSLNKSLDPLQQIRGDSKPTLVRRGH